MVRGRLSDLGGGSVRRWQGLEMEGRSVEERWYQSFGLRADLPGEVRKREKGREREGQGS